MAAGSRYRCGRLTDGVWCTGNCRDGGVDEEGGEAGRGADGGGAQSAVRGVQECDRSAEGVVADHVVDRAEGGEQGQRAEREAHQGVPAQGGGRAVEDLPRHPDDHRRALDPVVEHGRVDGVLLQDVGGVAEWAWIV